METTQDGSELNKTSVLLIISCQHPTPSYFDHEFDDGE